MPRRWVDLFGPAPGRLQSSSLARQTVAVPPARSSHGLQVGTAHTQSQEAFSVSGVPDLRSRNAAQKPGTGESWVSTKDRWPVQSGTPGTSSLVSVLVVFSYVL